MSAARTACLHRRHPRRSSGRVAVSAVLAATCIGSTVNCAGAPPGPPSETRLLAIAPFAGEWDYDADATARAANLRGASAEDHLASRASDVTITEMRARGERGNAVDGTPAGIRQTMLMVGQTPQALTFEISADTLSLRYGDDSPHPLPVGGEWMESVAPQGPIDVRLRWSGAEFAVERRIQGGATIRDAFSILDSGHLLLTRDIVWRQPQRVGLIVFSGTATR